MINFTGALEMLKTARASASQLDDAKLKQHLLDLQGHLLHLQVQVLEQQVENRELQHEVVHLRECLATERRLERVFDAYVVVESSGNKRGPFCSTCWDGRQTLQLLVEAGNGMGYCPSCKETPRIGVGREDAISTG